MDQEIATLKLNINQLAGITGVHRQTVATRLKNDRINDPDCFLIES